MIRKDKLDFLKNTVFNNCLDYMTRFGIIKNQDGNRSWVATQTWLHLQKRYNRYIEDIGDISLIIEEMPEGDPDFSTVVDGVVLPGNTKTLVGIVPMIIKDTFNAGNYMSMMMTETQISLYDVIKPKIKKPRYLFKKILSECFYNNNGRFNKTKLHPTHNNSIESNIEIIEDTLNKKGINYIEFNFLNYIPKQTITFKKRSKLSDSHIIRTKTRTRDNVKNILQKQYHICSNGSRKKNLLYLIKDVDSYGITSRGFDLSYHQQKALHAIETLMSVSYYNKCFSSGMMDITNRNTLPVLSITPYEYYEAYNVKCTMQKDGQLRFNGASAIQAMDALISLSKVKGYVNYKVESKETDANGNKQGILIEECDSLICLRRIFRYKQVKGEIQVIGKNNIIEIIPNRILIADIHKKFVMRRTDYISKISESLKSPLNTYAINLMDVIYNNVAHTHQLKDKQSLTLTKCIETIVVNMGLDTTSYWNEEKGVKRWDRIFSICETIFSTFKEQGVIKNYVIDMSSKTVINKISFDINLRSDMFYTPKKSRKAKSSRKITPPVK